MSSLLSDAEREAIRETLASHRTATVTVERNTPADDGQHGFTDNWAATATVDAYLEERSSRGELAEGGRPVSIGLWLIELPWETDVTTKDRLVSSGVIYEILSIDADPGEQLATYCTCRKAV